MKNNNNTFLDNHTKLNMIISILVLIVLFAIGIFSIKFILQVLGDLIMNSYEFLKRTVTNTDTVIIVAMITGSVSILGVVISSIIAKIVDYRFNVKKYLYDKREMPYEKFIDMVYRIMEDTKKTKNQRLSEQEMISMISEFSKGLTLWGSNGVVKKWIKYRNQCKVSSPENLFLLEEIIYEMRKDVGLKRKMKKGKILSFFVNDIDTLLNEKR